MRRVIKGIIVGIAFLFFFVPALRRADPVNAASPDLAGPDEIYSTNCAKCHGNDGRAKTAKGKRSGATDFTSDWNRNEERGIRIITNGKGQMPSFKNSLSSDEIRSVFGYVLGFSTQKQ